MLVIRSVMGTKKTVVFVSLVVVPFNFRRDDLWRALRVIGDAKIFSHW